MINFLQRENRTFLKKQFGFLQSSLINGFKPRNAGVVLVVSSQHLVQFFLGVGSKIAGSLQKPQGPENEFPVGFLKINQRLIGYAAEISRIIAVGEKLQIFQKSLQVLDFLAAYPPIKIFFEFIAGRYGRISGSQKRECQEKNDEKKY